MKIYYFSDLNDFIKNQKSLLALLKLLIFLYLFILSLQLMGDSLRLFGSEFSRTLIETTTNPVIALFIGILATSIIQSSSSTTSIVVGMVAGGALSIEAAIPIIMGANIGTSITCMLASLPQISRSNEFRRAFAAATVHDFFNFLSTSILFPLQIATGFLSHLSGYMADMLSDVGGLEMLSPVKAITKPVSKFILENLNSYFGEGSLFAWFGLGIALILLFLSLKNMVSALKTIVVSRAKEWFDKYLFATAIRAFVVGIILTMLVQSSSITTSLMVPMAGAGLLSLVQIFPYTLGSNIGTTVTAILAALITGEVAAVTVAFAHLLFNICGIIIWWPMKFVPIKIAEKFSEFSVKNKAVPVVYVVVVFFVLPVLFIYIFN